jgi:hypothetical protein
VTLGTEVSSRDSHGGEGRINAARFPQRKTLYECDFTFQRSVKKTVIEHLGQLDFLHAAPDNRPPGGPQHGPVSVSRLDDRMTLAAGRGDVPRADTGLPALVCYGRWCGQQPPADVVELTSSPRRSLGPSRIRITQPSRSYRRDSWE